jgi:two-component system cell cycle sensor histidine kinase/response regulator CckA
MITLEHPPAPERPPGRPLRGAGELILVVDDEPAIGQMARLVLELHGYRVLVCNSAKEALDSFDAHHNDVAVMISDLNMPVISGDQLTHRMLTRDPELRVLLTSGDFDQPGLEILKTHPRVTFLPKPWHMHEFLKAVRTAILERARSEPTHAPCS